jgi:hypothetical protein
MMSLGFAGQVLAADFYGTRPLGMGGAHRSIVTGNDAIYLNPAGMSLYRHFSTEGFYSFSPSWGSANGPEQHLFNVSAVDNQMNPYSSGFAYTRFSRGDLKEGNRFDLAFAGAFSDSLFVGTNIKYINFHRNDGASHIKAVTADLGLLVHFDFGLNLGLVGYNLTNTADYLEHPVSMAAAISYSPFMTLVFAFDWCINFQYPVDPAAPLGDKKSTYSFHFGAEYLLGHMTVRAGFALDNTTLLLQDEKYWSVGLAYVTKQYAFDLGYQGSLNSEWNNTFSAQLRLFM